MMTFIDELRAAHAVFTAHKAGAHTVGQITLRTGLPAHVCAGWVGALRLPVEHPRPRYIRPAPTRRDIDKLNFDI